MGKATIANQWELDN